MTKDELRSMPYRARWRAIEEVLASPNFGEAVYYLEHARGTRTLRRLLELAETPAPPQHLALRAVGWRMQMGSFGFFRDLFERSDLSDEMREVATDVCCGGLSPWCESHPDYEKAIDLLAAQLSHPFSDVRFSACFSLGRTRALRVVPLLEPYLSDETWSQFGQVSKIADLAIRSIRGEDVDMHDAFERRPKPSVKRTLKAPRK